MCLELGLILTPTTDLTYEDGEVVDFKWLTPEEFKEFLKKDEKTNTPVLSIVFEKAERFRKRYLNK